MLEKLKNFFYDISDIILCLLIIAAMYYTISWKLTDSMAYYADPQIPTISVGQNDEETDTSEEIDQPTDGEGIETPPVTDSETDSTSTEESVEGETETATGDAKPSGGDVNIITVEEITIDIPSGSSAHSIATQLKDAGLIEDVQAFLTRLTEMGLDSKLRAGSFTLSSDMTMDEIINGLTGN